MMYLFWFTEFMWQTFIIEPFAFAVDVVTLVGDLVVSVGHLIGVFPMWLKVPFTVLLSIAVLFRVSQFIPSLGGASN